MSGVLIRRGRQGHRSPGKTEAETGGPPPRVGGGAELTQRGRRGRLSQDVALARRAVLSTVETAFPPAPAPVAAQSPDRAEAPGLLLVGLSGGPDSLALSAAAAPALH